MLITREYQCNIARDRLHKMKHGLLPKTQVLCYGNFPIATLVNLNSIVQFLKLEYKRTCGSVTIQTYIENKFKQCKISQTTILNRTKRRSNKTKDFSTGDAIS